MGIFLDWLANQEESFPEIVGRGVVTDGFQVGRMNTFDPKKDAQAVQWSAFLDNRVCPYCEDRDGLVMMLENPDVEMETPPAHGRCRCIWIWIGIDETNVKEDWYPPDPELLKSHAHFIADLRSGLIKDAIYDIMDIMEEEI